MRIPQVTDRMKEAPAQALRAVFSGIGQLLMAAEKIRGRAEESDAASQAAAGRTARDQKGAAAPPPYSARWRSLDMTGNVRILAPEELDNNGEADQPAATVQPEPPARLPEQAVQPEPAAWPEPPARPPEAPGARFAALPVPNYDNLSIASLRARLRTLDRAQLTVLLDYEQANAGRGEFLTMLERRIAKLDDGQA